MSGNPQPVSRRGVGKRVIAALFASSAAAAPAPGQSPQEPQDDLSIAREANRKNAKLLLEAKLPPSTEPSFRFEP
jgi:hypothetical protein